MPDGPQFPVDIDPVDSANANKIAQPIQRWANERGAAIPLIHKLPLWGYGCAVIASALAECGNLAFDGVRGRLLFAGDARVERSSNRGHRSLRWEDESGVAVIKREVKVGSGLNLKGESKC